MILTEQGNNHRLLYWSAGILLLMGFAFGDAATVALSASLVTPGQLFAFAFSFALIGWGLLFTIWQMSRS
jgi:hypothetical protein